MNVNCVEYQVGYHWVLKEPSVFKTDIVGYQAITPYVSLSTTGEIYLSAGYATDGISGITGYPWEKLLARPCLINNCWPHDGFYQLMRLGLIPANLKYSADMELRNACIRDGGHEWYADTVFSFVNRFGKVERDDTNAHAVRKAP